MYIAGISYSEASVTDKKSLKAIQTEYNGFRFRSRLEARWAVFFDTLRLPWTYESEGFDLGEAGWYLPDFHLPTLETWVEVKPGFNVDINQIWTPMYEWERSPDFKKAEAFGHRLEEDHRLIVLHGDPWPGAYFAEVFHEGWDAFYLWCECPKCRAVNIQYEGASNRNCTCVPFEEQGASSHNLPNPPGWRTRIDDAFRAARGARFERGGR